MTKRVSIGLVVSAAIIVIGVAWWLMQDAAKRSAEAAARNADAYFARFPTAECDTSLQADLALLLKSPEGCRRLRDLATTHESIVFHEDSRTVYYAHKREGQPKSCVGTVTAGGDRLPIYGHAGLPSCYALKDVALAEDCLIFRCQASAEDEYADTVRSFGLEPGAWYRVKIELSQLRGRWVKGSDIKDFEPCDAK